MGESASMGDLACSQSIDVILTPTGRMALTQWRLRWNLSCATERSICKLEEPFETHPRLKLPTSTLARFPLQSSLRLTDRLQSTDNFEFRRILMERNSIIKTADLLRMSTSNVQQVEREAWWIKFQFSLDLWQFYFWDCRSSHHPRGMSGYLAEVNRGPGFPRCLLLSSWVLWRRHPFSTTSLRRGGGWWMRDGSNLRTPDLNLGKVAV